MWTTKPQSDSFSCASSMFSSLLGEIVSAKCLYWVSALNLSLEKPFFLCWVLRSHRISTAYVSTLAVMWIPPPFVNLKKLGFSRSFFFYLFFFCVCVPGLFLLICLYFEVVSVQSYNSVKGILGVEVLLIISCDIVPRNGYWITNVAEWGLLQMGYCRQELTQKAFVKERVWACWPSYCLYSVAPTYL